MTILATGIGKWPREKRAMKPRRNCLGRFLGARSEKYCHLPTCQEAKVRRERERGRKRGH